MEETTYLLKTLKKEHLEETVHKGKFCFCHPQIFSRWEDQKSAQYDRWEGYSAYEVNHIVFAPIISNKDGKIVYGQGSKIADRGIVHLQTDVAKKTPICCFRLVEESDLNRTDEKFIYSLGATTDRIRLEFQHDAFVLIKLVPFLERLGMNVSWYYARNVIYQNLLNSIQDEMDEENKEIIEQLFRKDERFKWQKEFRIILLPNEKMKSFVKVGSIEDISYHGDIDELKSGKLLL